MALVVGAALNAVGADIVDPNAADPDLRRFVESMGGEAYALEAGRIAYRRRWEQTLTDALYLIAPRGAWNASHPAWGPARKALSETLRREVVAPFARHRQNDRRLMNQESMYQLDADERRVATAFFESPVGRQFVAARLASAHADAWGLPPGVDPDTQEQAKAIAEQKLSVLDALPEDRGEGKAMQEFLDGPVWKKVLRLQLQSWADSISFSLNLEVQALVLEHKSELGAALRQAVPGIPPPSDKTYLGTVELAADRVFTVTVEHWSGLIQVGKYTLKYAPADVHWHDIAALAPGIKPGETRFLYVDAQSRAGDRP